MQVSVRTEDRAILQHGTGLGDLAGAEIADLTQKQEAQFLALLSQVEGDGHVKVFKDGRLERQAASQAHWDAIDAREAARAQREADLAAVKAHAEQYPDDAHWQALARLVGAP